MMWEGLAFAELESMTWVICLQRPGPSRAIEVCILRPGSAGLIKG